MTALILALAIGAVVLGVAYIVHAIDALGEFVVSGDAVGVAWCFLQLILAPALAGLGAFGAVQVVTGAWS
jgi:hypothetical protein